MDVGNVGRDDGKSSARSSNITASLFVKKKLSVPEGVMQNLASMAGLTAHISSSTSDLSVDAEMRSKFVRKKQKSPSDDSLR